MHLLRTALICLALTGCARSLTPDEAALLAPIHGETLAVERMRVSVSPVVGAFRLSYDARPRTTCRERIGRPQQGRIDVRTGGIVLFETLLLRPDLGRDLAAAPGGVLDLPSAMFLAHEATHVWQWQNRRLTGYHPVRAFSEQVAVDDPYLLDPEDPRRFLDYGFEQQATLVEEYLCCATLDADGARTQRLFALLRQIMPVAEPEAFPRRVTVPYAADLKGICS
ncbi:hypothetical protein [Jannaschia ovalis]|uniref:DUF4157 domain-containing protein n=1 Tax=Jannaschia ovalis TaxID=3038773 RepID=A0ABY8LCA7_9RHOB|nr:hypothetical protein [Jannaschia sp. GRR-S6-38]WGH78957.1 hypothetical protein P8627_01470 [Jannaschia sp. GRR-S6-38]